VTSVVEEIQLDWDEDGLHLRLHTVEDDVQHYRIASPEQFLWQTKNHIGPWVAEKEEARREFELEAGESSRYGPGNPDWERDFERESA
jgi:hypothetical protein